MARSYENIDTPRRARPAFISWAPGGLQVFPADPLLESARTARLLAAGRIIRTRRPAPREIA